MDLSGYTLLSVFLTICLSVYGQDTLTVREVFDFGVGDVFHYGEDASDYMPGGFYYKLDRITIVDKWYSQEGDTLFYKRHLEGYTKNLVPSGGEYPYEVRTYFHTAEDEMYYTDLDSTVFRYLAEGHFNYLKEYTHGPPESEISDSMVYESGNYCSRTINGYRFSDFHINDQVELGEGLGITFISTEYEECQCHVKWLRLLYYQKAADTCGSPDNRTVADWYPMLDVRNTWYNHIYEYFTWDINTEVLGLEIDTLDGSTLAGDTSYFQVYRAIDGAEVPERKYGFIRASGNRVYYRTALDKPERMLYDFNIEEGDTVTVYNLMDFNSDYYIACDYVCESVQVQSFYQVPRRVFHLTGLNPYEPGVERWIDGIGSYSGLLHNYNGYVGGDAFYLSCVKQSGMLMFKLSESQPCIKTTIGVNEKVHSLASVYPNPVGSGRPFTVVSVLINALFELYDSRGTLVFRTVLVGTETSIKMGFGRGLYFYRMIDTGGNAVKTGKLIFE